MVAVPAQEAAPAALKAEVKDLSFHYAYFQALKHLNMPVYA